MAGRKPSVVISDWKVFMSRLYEETDEETREKILLRYHLDERYMNVDDENESSMKSPKLHFFEAIDNPDIGEIDSARDLREQIKLLDIHTIFGESILDQLDKCITDLKHQQAQLEVFTNSKFIGRSRELDLAYDYFKDDDIKCVSICGLGGQGKTYLAGEILFHLKKERQKYLNVISVHLRDIRETSTVVKSMLSQTPRCSVGKTTDLKLLVDSLKQHLQTSDTRYIFQLDDCDSVVQYDQKNFLHFIKDFIQFLKGCPSWVKILITIRMKMSSLYKDPSFKEIELAELDTEDAFKMFKEYSGQEEIDVNILTQIVKECSYSPLAISMMADVVRCGKLTPKTLIFHLMMDKKNVTSQMKIDKCIKKSIENLEPDHLKSLVGLSVFQSSMFIVGMAEKIIKKCLGNSFSEGNDVEAILQSLHDLHLLEAVNYGKKDENSKHKCKYSLHPLVFRYLSEWKKPADLAKIYLAALQQFVSIFERMICKIVGLMESKQQKGQKKLDDNRVHILKYYGIVADQPKVMPPYIRKTNDIGLYQKKCVSDLADTLISLVQARRMIQNEADRALKAKNNEVYLFWMIEKADVYLMLHDKPDISGQILDELSNKKFTALQGLDDRGFYKPLIHALFHKVKGMTWWKLFDHEKALQHLDLSLLFFDKCLKPQHDRMIGCVKCYKGVVLIDLNQLDAAEEILKQALTTFKEMVVKSQFVSNTQDNDVADELHWDIPRIYLNLGKIILKRSIVEEDRFIKHQLLESALENINHGMKLDKLLKLDCFDGFYQKMKIRADIYIEKGLLEEALYDANFVMDQRREILQPPHTKFTESVYQVAKIYMLQGFDWSEKGDSDKARKHWVCAGDYFDEVKKHHLKEGGMALQNPVLQDIKRDHITIAKLVHSQKEVKIIQRFYEDLENGAYEPEKKLSSKGVIQMIYTPMELMKKWFGGGGTEFGNDGGKLAQLEQMAQAQMDNMLQGDTSGGHRKHSDMGHSSYESDSLSTGSESMSENVARLNIQKSLSIEDDVFVDTGTLQYAVTSDQTKHIKKRPKVLED
ncbi:hypothetical protein ACF0H5_006539 [Mactra antiquata]